MYKLEITNYMATVTIQSCDFEYLSVIRSAIDKAHVQAEGAIKTEVENLANHFLDQELAATKKPAKKRGRPAGSRNKK